MAKIQVELGGKYTLKDTISKAQNDLKQFGKDSKDVSSIATTSLKEISKIAGSDLAPAINGVSSLISGIVTGGLFGAVAAAASLAFSAIQKMMEETKKRAQELADGIKQSLVAGMERFGKQFQDIGKNADEGRKKVEELIKVTQGAHASDAKIKVAQLHIETLQKITDGMSDAGKKSITEHEKYQAALINWNSKISANEDAQQTIRQRQITLGQQLNQVTATLVELQSEESEWSKRNSAELARYQGLLKSRDTTIEDMVKAGVSERDAQHFHAQRLRELAEFEETHKAFVAEYNAKQEAINKGKEQEKKLQEEKSALESRYNQLLQEEQVIREEAKANMQELNTNARRAAEAYAKETQDKELAQAIQAEESALRLELTTKMSKLKLSQEENDRLMKVLNQGIEDELDEMEIRDNLQHEYDELCKERNKLQEKDNENMKNKNGDNRSSKQINEDYNKMFAHLDLSVNVANTEELGNQISEKTKNKLRIPKEEEIKRQMEREGRDFWTNAKFNGTWFNKFMQDWSTGKMSEEQKKSGIEALQKMEKEWTPEAAKAAKKEFNINANSPLSFVDAMQKHAVKQHMMTPRELQNMNQAIDEYKKEVTKKSAQQQKVEKMYQNIEKIASACGAK